MGPKLKPNLLYLFFTAIKQQIISLSGIKNLISYIHRTDKYSQKFVKDKTFKSFYLHLIYIFLHDRNYGTLLAHPSIYKNSSIIIYLLTLEERNQKIFMMFIQGYKYNEISDETGLPKKEIKTKIYEFLREFIMQRNYFF